MNIFVLDECPRKSARMHCDKHVVKMISESRQMMKLAVDYHNNGKFSSRGYVNHPCSIWARDTIDNYMWLYDLAEALNDEYKHRYGKEEDHKSWTEIKNMGMPNIPAMGLTQFALAMPEEYQNKEDVVESYRNYYIHEKNYFATWRRRERPTWWRVL